MSRLDILKYICSKNPKQRSSEDIDFLFELTKNNKVFLSLSSLKGTSLHRNCCRYLNYEFCQLNNYLFHYGSKGAKFYIIYSGIIAVEVPVHEDLLEEVLQLSDGECFGELALENDKPRQASIRCKTDCHLIYLNKQDYQECLGSFIKDRRNLTVDFLCGLPMFQDFTKGTLTKVSYILKEKSLKKGQTIYKEGDNSEEIFFIIKGETAFYKKIKAKNEKKINSGSKVFEVIVANKAKGEIFGEEEIVLNIKRTCTCKVVSDQCELYTTLQSDFFKSIKDEEFWNLVKSKAVFQQEQIEKRIQLLCEIKEATPVFPISLKKQERETQENKKYRRSITNLGSFYEKTAALQVEKFSEKNEPARSSKNLENLQLMRKDSKKSDCLVLKNLPSYQDQDRLLLKRSKSSILSQKILTPSSSAVEEFTETKKEISAEIQSTKLNILKNSSRLVLHSKLQIKTKAEEEQKTIKSNLMTDRSGVKTFRLEKEKIFGSGRILKKKSGVTIYPMNSFPIFRALWSPDPRKYW